MAQIGDRVRLIRCSDPYSNIEPGALGTVRLIDSLGTVHVEWDDGRRLGLVRAAGDQWTIVQTAYEVKQAADAGEHPEPGPGDRSHTWLDDAYDLDDPKHPTYHDRYADAYDMREGK